MLRFEGGVDLESAAKKRHLCLIFSPIDKHYRDAMSHFAPPLGLIALANYVEARDSNIRISILDGSVTHTLDEILTFIEEEKPDVVAQSIQLISYNNALIIAEYAHNLGLVNVFGGHHATQIAEAIAFRQKGIVDYVVAGDGEEALWSILQEKPIEEIPNLVTTAKGRVYRTPRVLTRLNSVPHIDYSPTPLEPYMTQIRKTNFACNQTTTNYLRIYSHKGCGNRLGSGGCFFCGRADYGIRFKSPQNFWEDIRSVVEASGADYVFDVGDDFLFNKKWARRVAEAKPPLSAELNLGVFGRANRIDAEGASYLAAIGVKDVVIGFESFDSDILRLCGKKFTDESTNLRAVEALFVEGIDVCASLVLGLPGESEDSLKKAIEGSEKIVNLAEKLLGRPPRELVANLIEPSPGSPAFNELIRAFPRKYFMQDKLSLEEIQRDYFRHLFNLDSADAYAKLRKSLGRTAREIHALVDFSDSQGWLAAELSGQGDAGSLVNQQHVVVK